MTRTFLKNGKPVSEEEAEDNQIIVREFAVPPAHVSANFRRTVNLGRYESMVVGIVVTVPCYPVKEEIDAAAEFVYVYATRKLSEWLRRGGMQVG